MEAKDLMPAVAVVLSVIALIGVAVTYDKNDGFTTAQYEDLSAFVENNPHLFDADYDDTELLASINALEIFDGMLSDDLDEVGGSTSNAISDLRVQIRALESRTDVVQQQTGNTNTRNLRIVDMNLELGTIYGDKKTVFDREEYVGLQGKTDDENETIEVSVYDPSGRLVKSKDSVTFSNGDITEVYEIKLDDVKGTYIFEIRMGFEYDRVQFRVQ